MYINIIDNISNPTTYPIMAFTTAFSNLEANFCRRERTIFRFSADLHELATGGEVGAPRGGWGSSGF